VADPQGSAHHPIIFIMCTIELALEVNTLSPMIGR